MPKREQQQAVLRVQQGDRAGPDENENPVEKDKPVVWRDNFDRQIA